MPRFGDEVFDHAVSQGPAYSIAQQKYIAKPSVNAAREAEEACRNVLTFLAYRPDHMADIRKWKRLENKWRRHNMEIIWTARCTPEGSDMLRLTFTSMGGEERESLKIHRSLRLAELHEKLLHHPGCIKLLRENGDMLEDPMATLGELFCEPAEPADAREERPPEQLFEPSPLLPSDNA